MLSTPATAKALTQGWQFKVYPSPFEESLGLTWEVLSPKGERYGRGITYTKQADEKAMQDVLARNIEETLSKLIGE